VGLTVAGYVRDVGPERWARIMVNGGDAQLGRKVSPNLVLGIK